MYDEPRLCNKLNEDGSECQNIGKWMVGFKLYAKRNTDPAEVFINVVVCEAHKEFVEVDDFLGFPETWDALAAGFIQAGKLPPNKRLTKLMFTEV